MRKHRAIFASSIVLILSISCNLLSDWLAREPKPLPLDSNEETIIDEPQASSFPPLDLDLETITMGNIQELTQIAEINTVLDVNCFSGCSEVLSIDIDSKNEKLVYRLSNTGYLINLRNGDVYELDSIWTKQFSDGIIEFSKDEKYIIYLPYFNFYSTNDGSIARTLMSETEYLETDLYFSYTDEAISYSNNLIAVNRSEAIKISDDDKYDSVHHIVIWDFEKNELIEQLGPYPFPDYHITLVFPNWGGEKKDRVDVF